MLRVVEARDSGIWICAEVVDVEALVDANHIGHSVSNVVIKRSCIGVATYRASSVRKLAPCIWFVGLVKGVGMVICCLLPTAADGSVVATPCVVVVVRYVPTVGSR